eukprot:364577-Chlamydomonas_euryale.AAC.27
MCTAQQQRQQHTASNDKSSYPRAGRGVSVIAADVLWSDPVCEPGLRNNDARGVGLTFGPDVTHAFLEANGVSLIVRSHEGPDARDKRTDLPHVSAAELPLFLHAAGLSLSARLMVCKPATLPSPYNSCAKPASVLASYPQTLFTPF